MPTLTCMRGLPGSGKTTAARELAADTDAVIVSRDQLRLAHLGTYWTGRQQDEALISTLEGALVRAALGTGRDVIVDATHLNPQYLKQWAVLAGKLGVDFWVEDVRTPVSDCIVNDSDIDRIREGKKVGHEVIYRMAKRYPMEKWPTITAPEPFEIVPIGPWPVGVYPQPAIICDIDGTIAHNVSRSPYDYTKVSEDEVDDTIRQLVNSYSARGYTVLMVSGRDDTCYLDTDSWLRDKGVSFDHLLMRPANARDIHGNKLSDYRVKYDLFNERIRNKFSVRFCLDDRRQVIDMWRALGLKVLDVAGNEF